MSRFVANPAFVEQVRRSPAVQRAERAAAEAIASKTVDYAPPSRVRGDPVAKTSIRVVSDEERTRVESTHPFWHLIEFGSKNNPAYAPMRRGVAATGFRLEQDPPR